MRYHASKSFWKSYGVLPEKVKRVADKNFELLKADPYHPSLHFKKIGKLWSVRAGMEYRALGVQHQGAIIWFWIGHHAEYDKKIS